MKVEGGAALSQRRMPSREVLNAETRSDSWTCPALQLESTSLWAEGRKEPLLYFAAVIFSGRPLCHPVASFIVITIAVTGTD